MSFVQERERRPNAGSRMRALLDQEVDMEELFEYRDSDEEDEEFSTKIVEEEEEDKVDSDFDIDSSEGEQEHIEEGQALDKELYQAEKRARRAATFNPPPAASTSKAGAKASTTKPEKKKPSEKRKRRSRNTTFDIVESGERSTRFSSRKNTVLNRLHVEDQLREHEKRRALLPKRDRPVVNKMTQEELLAEAAITEEINKDSLLEWQQMEAERKANAKKKDKRGIFGKFVRYHSIVEKDGPIMRNDNQATAVTNAENSNMDTETMTDGNASDWEISNHTDLMGRNLISFMDNAIPMDAQQAYTESGTDADKDLEYVDLIDQLSDWLNRPSKPNKPVICPVTGQVARYKDPSTGIPYANITAFQVIRACLYHEMRWAPTSGIYLGYVPSAKGVPDGWDAAI